MSFTSSQPPTPENLRRILAKPLRDHWLWLLLEGIALILLGTVAAIMPFVSGLATELFVGWVFLFVGVACLITALIGRKLPGLPWSILSAILAIVTGGILLWWPLSGMVTLTLVLGVYFIFDGVASIMRALDHRASSSRSWGWLLAVGLLDLVVAAMLITGLPGTAAWAIGLLVGVELLFGGMALVVSAVMARASTDT
jgi:uncharacterized membrane protein HdeD (DUF308 family)